MVIVTINYNGNGKRLQDSYSLLGSRPSNTPLAFMHLCPLYLLSKTFKYSSVISSFLSISSLKASFNGNKATEQ